MPAQSPTLSPTLSAITAGLRGSSSGMPASTLPTRSAPTSAPLVKMPPPRRAKIEISEEPNARPISGLTMSVMRMSCGLVPCRYMKKPATRDEAEAHHQHAGDGAALEGDVERRADAAARGFRGAHVGAHRDVHADVARRARGHRADREAARRGPAQHEADHDEQHHADDGDGRVLPVEVRLGARLHGRGDLAHARVAVRLAQDPRRREAPVEQGEDPARERDEDCVVQHLCFSQVFVSAMRLSRHGFHSPCVFLRTAAFFSRTYLGSPFSNGGKASPEIRGCR